MKGRALLFTLPVLCSDKDIITPLDYGYLLLTLPHTMKMIFHTICSVTLEYFIMV